MSFEKITTGEGMLDEARQLAMDIKRTAREFLDTGNKDLKDQIRDFVEPLGRLGRHLRNFVWDWEHRERRKLEGVVLGWEDKQGERWYLSDAWNLGNLVRTREIEYAQVWGDEDAIQAWINQMHQSQGEDDKGKRWPPPIAQLAECELMIYRVKVQVTPTEQGYRIKAFGSKKST